MENQNAESVLTFEVNVKLYNKEKGELIDAIAAGSKLTKADAGKFIENPKVRKVEEWLNISIEADAPCHSGTVVPKIAVRSHAKLTKADSGRITKGDAQ